jgi:hypothetical protein
MPKTDMNTYIVYFKYQKPVDKKPGPVTHYKLQANSLAEAEQLARRQANYPGMNILKIERAPKG